MGIYCLDAGHGNSSGARGNGLVEDEVALDMVVRIGHHLRAAGHETITTRTSPAFVTLQSRPQIAKREKADLLLSIHCNAAGATSANGAEALVVVNDTASKRVAESILVAVVEAGMKSRGVKWDNQGQHKSLYVLRKTYAVMPAVLLELGFLTNAQDAKRLADPKWRQRVSQAIARAITDGV